MVILYHQLSLETPNELILGCWLTQIVQQNSISTSGKQAHTIGPNGHLSAVPMVCCMPMSSIASRSPWQIRANAKFSSKEASWTSETGFRWDTQLYFLMTYKEAYSSWPVNSDRHASVCMVIGMYVVDVCRVSFRIWAKGGQNGSM